MKKDIIVILCDQLRPDFLPCYGFKGANLPNFQRLADMGICFDHSITSSPVCAPARASMMTGRYVSDHGVWTNDTKFRDNIKFLPEEMNKLGYKTGCFGKLHHYPGKDTKGFQVSYQMEENRLKTQDDYFKYLKEKHEDINSIFNIKDGFFKYPENEYYEHWITDKALEFLKNDNGQPIFSWISYQGPHGPMDPPSTISNDKSNEIPEPYNITFDPPAEVIRYRKSRNFKESSDDRDKYRKKYVDMIIEIDSQIGRILDFLEDSNRLKDTVIIFSTDHGDMCIDYGMIQKGPFPYSAQLEVPMIFIDPDNNIRGVHSDMLVNNIDIPATVIDIAGGDKIFASSRSIPAMIKDESLRRQELYSEFADSVRIISDHNFRFAYYPFAHESVLLKLDDETTNLSYNPDYCSQVNKYMQKIVDYMISSKGVKIEAQDLTPLVQKGLEEIIPDYKDCIPIAFPIASEYQRERLRKDGLDPDYNEFCKSKEIYRSYSVYWK